jgi:hypothetical protein
MLRVRIAAALVLCLLLCFNGPSPNVMAVAPPAYLGICQWKDCVQDKQVGSHKVGFDL